MNDDMRRRLHIWFLQRHLWQRAQRARGKTLMVVLATKTKPERWCSLAAAPEQRLMRLTPWRVVFSCN